MSVAVILNAPALKQLRGTLFAARTHSETRPAWSDRYAPQESQPSGELDDGVSDAGLTYAAWESDINAATQQYGNSERNIPPRPAARFGDIEKKSVIDAINDAIKGAWRLA